MKLYHISAGDTVEDVAIKNNVITLISTLYNAVLCVSI